MEFTLLAAAALAMVALSLMLRLAPARGITIEFSRGLADPAYSAIGFGLLVGRLAAMIVQGTNPVTHLGDILIIRGGVSTGVGSLAALAAWLYSTRSEARRSGDGVAVAALIGLAGWHAGCLFRDACAGTTSAVPWAITVSGSAVGRHPVELYAAALLLLAAVVLSRMTTGSGRMAGWALAASAGARLVTEPVRLSLGTGPVGWYAAGVVAGVVVVLVAVRTSAKPGGAT